MRLVRLAAVLAMAAILALSVESGDAAQKKKKKKKDGGITGAITSVEAGKDQVTLTVKSINKKSGQSKDVKITVEKGAKIEKFIGKKKDKQTSPASLADLTVGKQVIITPKPGAADQAERVLLASKAKKKKKNT